MIRIEVWAGFRTHILIPRVGEKEGVVGAIADNRPTWNGLTVVEERKGTEFHYLRDGVEVMDLQFFTNPHGPSTHAVVRAHQNIWIQEPALTVKVLGNGKWRAFGEKSKWTSDWKTLEHAKSAFHSTVHFPRSPRNKNYTVGVEFRQGGHRMRLRSNGKFTKLLDHRKRVPVPYEGCEAFGEGYLLKGVVEDKSGRALRQWELAGHGNLDPFQAWMHFAGWKGGAGAVVNDQGRTPPPGMDVKESDGYDNLWDPRSWCFMGPGDHITQTVERTL